VLLPRVGLKPQSSHLDLQSSWEPLVSALRAQGQRTRVPLGSHPCRTFFACAVGRKQPHHSTAGLPEPTCHTRTCGAPGGCVTHYLPEASVLSAFLSICLHERTVFGWMDGWMDGWMTVYSHLLSPVQGSTTSLVPFPAPEGP
jgi:hypothetical protein